MIKYREIQKQTYQKILEKEAISVKKEIEKKNQVKSLLTRIRDAHEYYQLLS